MPNKNQGTPPTFSNETLSLYQVFKNAKNSIIHLDFILSSDKIGMQSRRNLNLTKSRCNGIINDFKLVLSPESLKTFNDEMESDTMVFEAINDKLAQLKEGQRWEIEKQIDKIIQRNNDIKSNKQLN